MNVYIVIGISTTYDHQESEICGVDRTIVSVHTTVETAQAAANSLHQQIEAQEPADPDNTYSTSTTFEIEEHGVLS